MQTPTDKGWGDPRTLDYGTMVRYEVWPGHTVSVRNTDVGVVFAELIRQLRAAGWHGPDAPLDEWGYAKRLKRWAQGAGQQLRTAPMGSWSDHSWGTAIDLDTGVNPMYAQRPANPQAHTSMPIAACPRIAAALGLEWGGSWSAPWDPQHFQVSVTPAQLHAIAVAVRAAPAAHPMPTPPPKDDDVSYEDAEKAVRAVLHLPETGLAVPLGQHDNAGFAVLLVGMAQAQINRDRAESAQLQAMIAAVDPDKLSALIAAKIQAALPPGARGADDGVLVAATGQALREAFAEAATIPPPERK
jgi:hypothetical protein